MSDVVSFNIAGTRLPLFLFPSVALGPTEYLELGKYFSLEQPWHVLIPPMKEFKAGPEDLIKEITLHFADCLNEIHPQGPVVIGGWSAGATPPMSLARDQPGKSSRRTGTNAQILCSGLQSVSEDLAFLRLPERLVWCFGTVEFASAGRQPEQSAVRLLVLASPEISP